jgi:hypothetical protein
MYNSRFCFLFAVVAVGCGSEASDPIATSQAAVSQDKTSQAVAASAQATLVSGAHAGFQHRAAKSRFVTGDNSRSTIADGFEKVVGARGVFARDPFNGSVLAIPNADSGLETADAFSADPEVNKREVLNYFVGAGLPAAQVAGTHVTTFIRGTGHDGKGRDNPPKFVAYNVVIERQLGGIRVEDSFAWARLAKNGEVVVESVYWPEVDAAVVLKAQKLKTRLADREAKSQMVGRAKSFAQDLDENSVQVAIHHTPVFEHGTFRTYAVLDAIAKGKSGGKARVLHLDENGDSVRFDHENKHVAPSDPR